ncbi:MULTISPECIES: hypothetical protein [unclassified Rhizobium]|uniref:hypothetical protein n=1 Tax=unclassified Rhizobium TaxID=2613769 RepID=UPI00288B8182|nr:MULTISPECIES: hypothetical protein [unclassified Rhizobium]
MVHVVASEFGIVGFEFEIVLDASADPMGLATYRRLQIAALFKIRIAVDKIKQGHKFLNFGFEASAGGFD